MRMQTTALYLLALPVLVCGCMLEAVPNDSAPVVAGELRSPSPPLTSSDPRRARTLLLSHPDFDAEKGLVGDFPSWVCRDQDPRMADLTGAESRILVEVGWFTDPELDGLGFVLFDGSESGAAAIYRRTGLERRWDWEDEHGKYAFVVDSKGNGAYYDFTGVEEGDSVSPDQYFIYCAAR